MVEAALTAIGLWIYAVLLYVASLFTGTTVLSFLLGYLLYATIDLWRCWRSVDWRNASPIERALAVLLLFPIGSLFWMPWDLQRLFNRLRVRY